MKRSLRKMLGMTPETVKEREARERLEFFRSLPEGEQERFRCFIQHVFSGDPKEEASETLDLSGIVGVEFNISTKAIL